MPRGGHCNHPACHDHGEGCRMLTPAELAPTDEDVALAQQLVDEGWIQLSNRYRTLIRWREPPPKIDDMIAPEYRDTYFADRIRERARDITGEWALRGAMRDPELVEELVLTVRQWVAWKKRRNRDWRAAVAKVRERLDAEAAAKAGR